MTKVLYYFIGDMNIRPRSENKYTVVTEIFLLSTLPGFPLKCNLQYGVFAFFLLKELSMNFLVYVRESSTVLNGSKIATS